MFCSAQKKIRSKKINREVLELQNCAIYVWSLIFEQTCIDLKNSSNISFECSECKAHTHTYNRAHCLDFIRIDIFLFNFSKRRIKHTRAFHMPFVDYFILFWLISNDTTQTFAIWLNPCLFGSNVLLLFIVFSLYHPTNQRICFEWNLKNLFFDIFSPSKSPISTSCINLDQCGLGSSYEFNSFSFKYIQHIKFMHVVE